MDILKVIAAYVMLHFIRFLMILLFWPVLKRIGYGMTFNQVLLASYAGLRGAVGLSLAMMVFSDEKIKNEYLKDIILLHSFECIKTTSNTKMQYQHMMLVTQININQC